MTATMSATTPAVASASAFSPSDGMTRLVWAALLGGPALLVAVYGVLGPRTATLGPTPLVGDLGAGAVNALQLLSSFTAVAIGVGGLVLAIPVPPAGRRQETAAVPALAIALLGLVVAFSAWWNGLGFNLGLLALPVVALAVAVAPPPPPGFVEAVLRWALRAITWGSLVAAVVAPAWATGPHESLVGLPSRLAGLTTHPNVLGFLAVALLVLEWARRPRNLAAVATALGVIVWTESKTSWATVGVLVAVGLLRRAGWSRALTSMLVLALSLGVTVVVASGLAAPDRATARGEESAETFTGRTAIWEATLEVWQDQPVLGIGPRLWDDAMDRRFAGRVGFPPGHAHSQLIHTLGEAGLLGAATLVVALVALGLAAARRDGAAPALASGLFVVLVVSGFSEPRVRSIPYAAGFLIVVATLALASTPRIDDAGA